jgi:uncharacterized protein
MIIFFTMLALGLLLGFAGAGGSGLILAMLITFFGIPIHTALGTSLAAMFFTVLSGSFSHFREGNMVLRSGSVVGIFGAMGAYAGTYLASSLPANILIWISAGMLFLSSFLIFLRTRLAKYKLEHQTKLLNERANNKYFWVSAPSIGVVTGFLSGSFGLGATPFIQLGLLILLKMSIQQAAATSMIIILPTAFFGTIGYLQAGYVDFHLLLLIVTGTMIGSYIGAKFTSQAPVSVLRSVLIGLPILGGIIMLVK